MYPQIEGKMLRWAHEIADDRPMIHCEYAHAMGNSLGSFADYWRAIRATHGLQGGFIWDWVEQGILRPETGDWGYGGDFGDHLNDVNFCCNGMVNPDRTPKPQLWDAKRVMQPLLFTLEDAVRGLVRCENRDCFRNAREWLEVTWTLEADGIEVARGAIERLDVPPQGSATLRLKGWKPHAVPGSAGFQPAEKSHAESAEYFLTVTATLRADAPWAKKDHIVAWDQMALTKCGQSALLRSQKMCAQDGFG